MLDYLSRSSKNSRVRTVKFVASSTTCFFNSNVMGAEPSLFTSADCNDDV